MPNSVVERRFVIFGSSELFVDCSRLLSESNRVLLVNRSLDGELFASSNKTKFIRVTDYSVISDSALDDITNKSFHNIYVFSSVVSDSKALYLMNEEEIDEIVRVNLTEPVVLTSKLLRRLPVAPATFVFVSSSRAHLGQKGVSCYLSTKSALSSLASCLAKEYGRLGKYFYCLSLGLANTGQVSRLNASDVTQVLHNANLPEFITPGDLYRVLTALCNLRPLSGSTLYCDNGAFR